MEPLTGNQKRHLKRLAHGLKPTVYVGQRGHTSALAKSVDEALKAHELIKVKFIDFKEKAQKKALITAIADRSQAALIGSIGHVAIFYRRHADPQKRSIHIPKP